MRRLLTVIATSAALVAGHPAAARADEPPTFTWTAGVFGGAGIAPMSGDTFEAPATRRVAPSLGLALGMRLTLDDWIPELRVRAGLPFLLAGAELRLSHEWMRAPAKPYLGIGAGPYLAGAPHRLDVFSVPVSINGGPPQGQSELVDSFDAGHDGFGALGLGLVGGVELARGEESRLLLDAEALVLVGPSVRDETVSGVQGAALLVGLEGALSPGYSNQDDELSPKLVLGGVFGAIDGLIVGGVATSNVATEAGIARPADGALVAGGVVVGAIAGGVAGTYLGDAAEKSTLARVGLVALGVGLAGTVAYVASLRD